MRGSGRQMARVTTAPHPASPERDALAALEALRVPERSRGERTAASVPGVSKRSFVKWLEVGLAVGSHGRA
jgi:hypothetical protein